MSAVACRQAVQAVQAGRYEVHEVVIFLKQESQENTKRNKSKVVDAVCM